MLKLSKLISKKIDDLYNESKEKDMSIKINGLPFLVTVIFLILKLTHTISWSWLWVVSPLWIPVIIVSVLALLVYIVEILEKWQKK